MKDTMQKFVDGQGPSGSALASQFIAQGGYAAANMNMNTNMNMNYAHATQNAGYVQVPAGMPGTALAAGAGGNRVVYVYPQQQMQQMQQQIRQPQYVQQAVQYVQVDPRTGMYTPVQSEPMTYQAQPANHINPMTVRHVPVSAVYPPSTNEGYHAPAAAPT